MLNRFGNLIFPDQPETTQSRRGSLTHRKNSKNNNDTHHNNNNSSNDINNSARESVSSRNSNATVNSEPGSLDQSIGIESISSNLPGLRIGSGSSLPPIRRTQVS